MYSKIIKTVSFYRWDSDNLFTDRDFLLLLFSQLMTAIAASVFGIVLAIISDVEGLGSNYQSSATGVAIILMLSNLPGLFFSILAGVLADWYDRKIIMIVSSLVRFVFAMIFVVFTGWDAPLIAYSIVFLKSAVTQIYMPSQASIIPDVIKKKNILLANSVINLTNYTTYFLGIIGAGAFIKILGERNTFTVLGVMFLFGALAIPFIRVPKRENHVNISSLFQMVKDVIISLKEVFSYVISEKVQRIVMFHNFATTSFIFIIITIIFKLAKFLIGIDATEVGFVTMLPLIIGITMGMIFINTFAKSRKRMEIIHFGIIISAISFLIVMTITLLKYNSVELTADFGNIVSIDSLIWIGMIVSMTLIGLCFPLLIIPAQTIIHESTERKVRGRVFGVWFAINQALATLPAVVVGILADTRIGIPTTVTLMALSACLYAILLIPFRKLA